MKGGSPVAGNPPRLVLIVAKPNDPHVQTLFVLQEPFDPILRTLFRRLLLRILLRDPPEPRPSIVKAGMETSQATGQPK